jgi:hypothetical protein
VNAELETGGDFRQRLLGTITAGEAVGDDADVMAAIGLAGGLVVSFGLSMVLGKFLFMIDAFDRVAYAAGVVVVLVTGDLASSIPIQRAAGISSMEAIREG